MPPNVVKGISVRPFQWQYWGDLWLVRNQQLAEGGIYVTEIPEAPDLSSPYEQDFNRIEHVYLRGRGNFWIAWLDGLPVGYVGAEDTGEYIELRSMYVRSEYRRRGVGASLVQALIDHCNRQGARTVKLWTSDDGPGRFLYQKLGFRQSVLQADELSSEYAKRGEIRMRLELAAVPLVFLPATDPHDLTYGTIPGRIEAFPGLSIHQVHFPRLVWYNREVCGQAIAQIRALELPACILVGFSKSGLGAWNITRAIPGSISSTIIFDAPVARDNLPPWGTDPFYRDDAEWQQDLPLRSVVAFRETVSQTHRLVLISGTGFHQEMCTLSQALSKAGLAHVFLPRPDMQHHWNSGWIEDGLSSLLAPAHRVG